MRRLLILTLSMIFVLLFALSSYAAEMSVTYDKDITVGDTFEVKVEYTDDSIDLVRASIEYDDSVLEYVAGGASEGSGGIVAIDTHSDDGKIIKESILFEALKSGNTNIKVTTDECYDLDGNMLNNPWEEKSITIAKVDKEKAEKEKAEAEKAEAEKEKAEAEKAEAEKEKQDQTEKNNFLQYIMIGLTLILLIIVSAIVAHMKKKKQK